MGDDERIAELNSAAKRARSRVKEALKATAEREVAAYDPDFMGHSSHYVSREVEAVAQQREDESLAASLWGSGSDAKIKEFAERLVTAQSTIGK